MYKSIGFRQSKMVVYSIEQTTVFKCSTYIYIYIYIYYNHFRMLPVCYIERYM